MSRESMSPLAVVRVHPSQFPERVRDDLLVSLRTRQIQHKFHYDSVKQAQKWLRLHEAYSPARRDADARALYEQAATAVATRLQGQLVQVVGLGCGGGQKDMALMDALLRAGCNVHYVPLDVSLALTLVARTAALHLMPPERCQPFVCDLGVADDLPQHLESLKPAGATRCFTFFGMMPNFEPAAILPKLQALLKAGECLLVSTNLAPGPDYAAGVAAVLPQYDNPLTHDWLMTLLHDLGVENADGRMGFAIELDLTAAPLRRITAQFVLERDREISLDDERIVWRAGETIRLFFSYRHTPELVTSWLGRHRISVEAQWVGDSGEEGMFLGRGR